MEEAEPSQATTIMDQSPAPIMDLEAVHKRHRLMAGSASRSIRWSIDMTNILHVCCSPVGRVSESYRLAQKIIDHLLRREPMAVLVNRVIGGGALPHVDQNYAAALGAPQPTFAEIFQQGSFSLSEELIQELESADVVVISTPMHNLTVPSVLKAWIDHVVRVRRTFTLGKEGKIAMLPDRPVYVAVASGGRFSGERARQPDFLTPYLKAILAIIGLQDLTVFSVEGTGAGAEAVGAARARTDRALQAHFSAQLPPAPAPLAGQRHLDDPLDAEVKQMPMSAPGRFGPSPVRR